MLFHYQLETNPLITNYLKQHIATIESTTVLIEYLMDYYCDNREVTDPQYPQYANHVNPVVYPHSDDWLATTVGNDCGETCEAVVNLTYLCNSGHKQYGHMTIVYREDYYHVKLDRFTLTIEVNTPFVMDRAVYTKMYKAAKDAIREFYEVSFLVPLPIINNKMMEYKLTVT